MDHHKTQLICFSTLLLWSILSATDPSSWVDVEDDETTYLMKLREALTPLPSDWFNNTNTCQWTGVSCSTDSPSLLTGFTRRFHRVETIKLSSMSLSGTLPPGLNNSLPSLQYLHLQNNSLSGPLPSLANLFPLKQVFLHDNNFSSIPNGCFQGLTSLEELSLTNNPNLAPWTFPTELADQSSDLYTLDLVSTNLRGFIPDIFDSFPRLDTLSLSNNHLTGILPKSLARFRITTLWLNDNELSGTIGVLSSMTYLNQVWLQGNSFEGPIPDLSNCTRLSDLLLQQNRLAGVVPLSLTSLPNLVTISLQENFLQGPMPAFGKDVNASLSHNGFCLGHFGPCDRRVTTLIEIVAAVGYPSLLARSWKGNNPCQNWSFIVCTDGDKIRTVNLTRLNLTGTISPAFANLTDLHNLYLGGNNLTGSIPESLATLPQLEILDVSDNNLSGNLPKFSPKVKFIATHNVLLAISQANGTTPSTHSGLIRPSSTPWILGASIASAGVFVIFVVTIYNRKRCLSLIRKMVHKKTLVDQNVEDFISSYGPLALKRYSFSEVKKMTNSFHDILGQGGFGTVYKASLTDGRQVAVKILKESKGRGEEFINEVASISRTSHVNIVSLLGFCYEMSKRALIYEFMPNGSLDKFINKKGSPNAICNLGWNTLFQITTGIARGLEYLHRGCSPGIVHLDIKPGNILLDEDFCPKIADFGLAKICKKKESIISTMDPRGTYGFIAPEVIFRTYGRVSHKSDVFSYGMLILKVVGGTNNCDKEGSHTSETETYFPQLIYKELEQDNIPASCRPVTTGEEVEMVRKIYFASLWCIQTNPLDRPSMSKVVEMLEGPLESLPFPPKPFLCSLERPPLTALCLDSTNMDEKNSITAEKDGSIESNIEANT